MEEIKNQIIATKQVKIILIIANMTNQTNTETILDMEEETIRIHMDGETDLNNQEYRQLQERKVWVEHKKHFTIIIIRDERLCKLNKWLRNK